MGVLNLIAFLGCLVFAGLGGAGVWWWDRHGEIAWTVPAPVRWVLPGPLKHIAAPPGPIPGLRQAAQKAQDGQNACRASLDSQSAAIARLGRQSAAALAKAAQDVDAARAVAESYRQAEALGGYRPKGADACARLEDADHAVLEALK